MNYSRLSPSLLAEISADENKIVIDTRATQRFADGFVPGSVSIAPDQLYPVSFHGIFPAGKSFLLVVDEEMVADKTIAALNGIGFTAISGYWVAEGPEWVSAIADMVITIEPDELAMDIPHDENLVLIDVRSETEFAEGHIKDAQHLALEDMGDMANIALIPEQANVYLYCSNSKRAMTAASLLKIQGMHNLRVVADSWDAISTTPGLEIVKVPEKLN